MQNQIISTQSQRDTASDTKGKRLLIIGGDGRCHQIRRLYNELCLACIVWQCTRETDASRRRFEHLIRGRGFDIVVLLSGLVRHQHLADVRRLCRQEGIQLLVLYRSPNPSQVSAALKRQMELRRS